MVVIRALRWLGSQAGKIFLVAILSVPAFGVFFDGTMTPSENRVMASLPSMPGDWAALAQMPRQLDSWVNDHFGFRADLVLLNNELRYQLLNEFPSIQMAQGRHGRIFLAAHGTNVPPYSALTNVCGGGARAANDGTVEYFNSLFADFHRMGLRPHLLIVPSAPVVYSDDVPAWLEKNCASEHTAVSDVLASPQLDAAARRDIFYPIKEMRAIRGNEALFPKTWFHWSGPALAQVAQFTVARFWDVPAPLPAPLPTYSKWELSDVSHLFPGIEFASLIVRPDLAASHIDACFGPACFPELGSAAEKLNDISRFHNPAAPRRRLLILSDSFGSKISPWFTRHYDTVEQFATNNVPHMDAQQILTMKTFLFRDPADTDLLILYHDGGAVFDTLKFGVQPLHRGAAIGGRS